MARLRDCEHQGAIDIATSRGDCGVSFSKGRGMRRCRMVRVRARCRQRLVTIAYDSIAQLRSLFSKVLLVCSALRGPYLRLPNSGVKPMDTYTQVPQRVFVQLP